MTMKKMLLLGIALFFIAACGTPEPPPEDSMANEAYFHPDSIARELLQIPSELSDAEAGESPAIGSETRRRLQEERQLTTEKLQQKIEESTMKNMSCQAILDRYAQALISCVVEDRCRDLENFDSRDIAFRRCRTGEWKTQFDSLEWRYR